MEEAVTTTKSSPSPPTTAQSPQDHGGSPGELPVQDKYHCETATGVLVRLQIDANIKEEQIVEAEDQAEKQQQQEQEKKRLNKFSNKILVFQVMVFGIFYSGFFPSASSSATQDNTRVAKAADMFFFIAFLANTFSVWQPVLKLPLQWRSGLAWFTCICLEISAYLFLVSLNRWYAFAILSFPLFWIVAISITLRKGGDKDDKDLKGIFENSAVLVTGSGLAGAIFGSATISPALGSSHFQGRSVVHALANLVFCVIAIGLYLMLITTVRSEMLVVHAKHFFTLLLMLVILAGAIISTTKFFM